MSDERFPLSPDDRLAVFESAIEEIARDDEENAGEPPEYLGLNISKKLHAALEENNLTLELAEELFATLTKEETLDSWDIGEAKQFLDSISKEVESVIDTHENLAHPSTVLHLETLKKAWNELHQRLKEKPQRDAEIVFVQNFLMEVFEKFQTETRLYSEKYPNRQLAYEKAERDLENALDSLSQYISTTRREVNEIKREINIIYIYTPIRGTNKQEIMVNERALEEAVELIRELGYPTIDDEVAA